MSAPVQHKPNGLVSGSKCPWEQSPLAETKQGWLRCHLHHKGKPFLPEPLPLHRAAHHIYQRLCTHVTSAFCFFFCASLSPPSSFPLVDTVCPLGTISTAVSPPPLSSAKASLLVRASRFLLVMCSARCASLPPCYKEPLTHLLLFFFSPLALAG